MSLNPYLIDIMFRVPNEVMDRVEDNYEYIEDLVQDKFNCRIRLETTSLRNDRTTMVSVSSKKPLPEGCFVFVQNMVLQKRRSRREERRPRREERKPRRKEKREDSRIVKEIAIKESSIPIAIGSKRSNIKRIIELVGERGTYIRIPRREENSNKFTIFANTEEAMEKIIEEFRQFMENDEKEPKYMPTEKEVKEVKEEEVEEEDLTMKSGGWDDQ